MMTIISLIATHPRVDALLKTSIPSIAEQTRLPEALVLVTDSQCLSSNILRQIIQMLPGVDVHVIENCRSAGVAGTWNTGVDYIAQSWPQAYVAFLDDDDSWDREHLNLCQRTADQNSGTDIVISGLRMFIDKNEVPRQPLLAIDIEDFLIGNPGWQGSNTFTKVSKLLEAGGFRESLASCHDRDLAIRILDLPSVNIAFTGQFSATWNVNAYPNSLTQASPQKKSDLRQFLNLHGHRMNKVTQEKFMSRCFDLFAITANELQ